MLLLLPAAAQRLVEPDYGDKLVAIRSDETQLGVELLALAVQHLEVGRDTACVADIGQSRGIARRDLERLLLHPELAALLVLSERVGNFTEGLEHCLLIQIECDPRTRFGCV